MTSILPKHLPDAHNTHKEILPEPLKTKNIEEQYKTQPCDENSQRCAFVSHLHCSCTFEGTMFGKLFDFECNMQTKHIGMR